MVNNNNNFLNEFNPNIEPYLDPYTDPYSMLIPPKMNKDENSVGIIKELSARKVFEQIRHQLYGEFWDSENKKWEKIPYYEPLMNDYGTAYVLRVLSSHLTDIITFSSYKEEDVPSMVMKIMRSIVPNIYINYKDFGIKNKTDIPTITNEIFVLICSAFRKSIGAGDRGVIGRTITEEIRGMSGSFPNVEKEGFLKRLNPFKR